MNRAARRLLAVGGGLAAAVLVGEVAVRLAEPVAAEELLFGSPEAGVPGLYRANPVLVTEPVPGFSGRVVAPGYAVDIHINTLGLRGAEPGAGPHWVAIGDSFTIAVQTPEVDTFPARLGRGRGVEVLNAGVDGYSTWQATKRYRALADVLPLEGVVLTYFLGNDLHDNERLRNPPPGGAADHLPQAAWHDPLTRLLFPRSALYAWLQVWTKGRELARPDPATAPRFRDELSIFATAGEPRLRQLLPASEAALTELRDEAARRGDRLLVAVAQPSFVYDAARARQTLGRFGLDQPTLDAPRAAIVALLGRVGIPTCDLDPPLRAAIAAGRTPYLRFDGHWTADGHAVVAAALAACLDG